MIDERLYQMGLGFVPGMDAQLARYIVEAGIGLDDFFNMPMRELIDTLGINSSHIRLDDSVRLEALDRARKEEEFIHKHHITFYSLLDDSYPTLLREIPDAPVNLYKLGNASLDCEHVLSMVGTRKPTSYGTSFCASVCEDLGAYLPDTMVVSGLAYGIDAAAHQGALDNGLTTVAVVAHGLDTIYPAANRDLARRIIAAGGAIVSEYPQHTTPYPKQFLQRNRIIAGLSQLVIVVESDVRGGALNTANTANSYSRDVMALPGRVSDQMSTGCNNLIRRQRANLVTCAADILEFMNWCPVGFRQPVQRNLFPELEGDQAAIHQCLQLKGEAMSAAALHQATRIPVPALLSALGEMEFEGIVHRLPGNRFSL